MRFIFRFIASVIAICMAILLIVGIIFYRKDIPVETLTNAEVLRAYCEKSFVELVQLLEDGQLLEHGYAKRDLALAVLVAFHHFNLERALGGMVVSQRQILFSPYRHAEQIEI